MESLETYFQILKFTDYKSLLLAGTAFVIFVVELVMSGMPRFPENREETAEEKEFDAEEALASYDDEEETERFTTPVPRRIELDCPICGRPLEVKTEHTHHRCPVCGEVFELIE